MHNNLIAARDRLQGPQTWDHDMTRLTAGQDNERIWLDAVITPNVSLNNRVALTLAASLILPGSLICLATAWMGAWMVTPLVFLSEVALGVMILWHARSLGQYRQRVCLTDTALFVETRSRDAEAVIRSDLSPHWLRIDRVNDTGCGCDAVRLRAGPRHVDVGTVLSPPERASLADAIEAALQNRRRGQSLAA
ncbi:DUF2244 domain-containing protein [Hyphomonas sp. CY54-11-8]|uniref:DUF2244 domain-containing protein n=2 Tax=Hyphomonas TaxID=85 RepID=UPI000458BD89|nr:DUF2244 domain-containing protein [Hyphomonas sp. CY54-11-8]KCZ46946.1 hypothetical protein HY17_05965 [Hyphomonas sp. CY54-11-8]RAN38994.1 hypothetical protein HY26_03070 [Hyphomonas sp. GM-8P]